MIDFGTEGNELLASDMVRASVLIRINAPDPADVGRAWGGVGDLPIPADNIEPEDATYKGIGDISGLPEISQVINGQAQSVTLTVAGTAISAMSMRLLTEGAEGVIYERVNIGVVLRGNDEQQVGPTVWLWEGEISSVEGRREPTENGDLRSVSITVGSAMTGRRRPRTMNFTDAHQRRISSDDAFFDRIAAYASGTTIKWP